MADEADEFERYYDRESERAARRMEAKLREEASRKRRRLREILDAERRYYENPDKL